jgi:hypothetical protein
MKIAAAPIATLIDEFVLLRGNFDLLYKFRNL